MRKTVIKLLLLLIPALGLAQQNGYNNLKKALKTTRTDSARFSILLNLALFNEEINRDTALYYYEESFSLAKKNNQRLGEALGLRGKGYMLQAMGRFPESLSCLQQALKIAEDPGADNLSWDLLNYHNPRIRRLIILSVIHLALGDLMVAVGDLQNGLFQHKMGKQLAEESGQSWVLGLSYMNLGYNYYLLNQPDSDLSMHQKAERIFKQTGYTKYLGYVYQQIGDIYLKNGNKDLAIQYFHKSLGTNLEQKNLSGISANYHNLTNYYLSTKQKDSSLYYSKKTLEVLHSMASRRYLDEAYDALYQSYKLNGKTDSAYKYQSLALIAKDSVFNATSKSLTDYQKLSFKAQIHLQELEKEKEGIQTKIRTYVLLAAIGVLVLLAGIFYRNNRQKQIANVLLSRQKDEIEAQARESQIEAALERVRSRTMAMQKSEELREVIQVVYEQFLHLGLDISSAGFTMDYKESDDWNNWIADSAHSFPNLLHIPYFDHLLWNSYNEARRKGLDGYTLTLTQEQNNSFLEQVSKYIPITEEAMNLVYNAPGYAVSSLLMKNVSLYIDRYSIVPFSDADNAILLSFGKVFEQTYTRFKDLEQAEEQAREAHIEAALERVRSRTMAMQKSEELREVIQVVYEQFLHLGLDILTAGFVLDYNESENWNIWSADAFHSFPSLLHIPYFDHPQWNRSNDAKRKGLDFFANTLTFEEKNSFFEQVFENVPEVSKEVKELVYGAPGYANSNVFLKNVSLYIDRLSTVPFSEVDNAVLKRFAKVFEQTYTRFKDLEQAEAQTREAQIEAALERVRSRTMAMQKSGELAEVIQMIYDQFVILNFNINIASFDTGFGSSKDSFNWIASSSTNYTTKVFAPYCDNPVFNIPIKAFENGSDNCKYHLTAEEKKQWLDHFFKTVSPLPHYSLENLDRIYNSSGYYNYTAIVKSISLSISNYLGYAYSEAEEAVVMRFCKVFAQTYTRFKDLEQAEEQGRESQIEAALERVRGKAMAMYNSADLTSTASLVFTELQKLGINPIRCGVGMINNQSRKAALYSATSSLDGDSLGLVGWVMLEGHPILEKIYDSIINSEEYYPVLKGTELKAYYEKLLSGMPHPSIPTFHLGEEQFGHFFPYPDGSLYAWSERRYDETEIRILRRFASVIDLTFRRYYELQKSEQSAREAIRQASIDRVRAEIASMRTTKDLERIIPLVWDELTILGIPFIRCGVFIVEEERELIHTHLSTPDGKALAAYDLPFDAEGIGRELLPAWRKKQIASLHWTAKEFADYTKNLVSQGAVSSGGKYITERPDTSLDLHFFPFLQGMLYVGNANPLTDNEKELVLSLAEAFSTAYARYEDFNKLEVAKQEVDKTLTELKTTQIQLIQTEKMATLGELTAGIAHEIQNPLNFVNNFSEINAELLEELKASSQKGERDRPLEIELINDLIENSKKINLHGKRADSIVKGMLQHSQSGSGKKELTNINTIADEYMRLAYHGLRAKDKSFNAEMVTHFDERLPKINVIPQDLGRVMLNLFNNAFYAVSKRQETAGEGYKPEVLVSTSMENGQIIIVVKDNGIGIPEAIKGKIMQPFFTTKPTGEGTGLGLSLTYDMVVKGHGGTIEVNTKEFEFTEFIIKLPVQ